MRCMKIVLLVTLLIPGVGYCEKWQVPNNVTVRAETKRASYMESVDFSYLADRPLAFAQLKMCVAENISNNAVTLQDSANSFVGPATGNWYRNSSTQTVQGSGIFKYLDDSTSTLIASGTTGGGGSALGLTHDIVKFDLKAVIDGNNVTLKFVNVTRAQQNTGASANDGFQPVGMWWGAGAQRIYAALETSAGKVKSCLQ